jgi:hypothetical protein
LFQKGGKSIEKFERMWDIPRVITTKADVRKRVVIPHVKPGHVYAIERYPDGSFTLTEVKPVKKSEDRPVKVRLEKRGRYTVGVTDKPINMEVVNELLKDFP